MGKLCRLGTFGKLLVLRKDCTDPCLQVLFTADLKAFSDYGLVTPVPSPKKQDALIHRAAVDSSSAAVRSARKRNAKQVHAQDAPKSEEVLGKDNLAIAEASSLAVRVKKRRPVSQVPR
jgi:hypothetical protein